MKLERHRSRIDAIDREVVALLNRRAEIVREIGAIKAKAALPVVDRDRETQVLESVTSSSEGPLDADALERIYRAVLIECRQIQASIREEHIASGAPQL
ncbi:MAG: chorismate mutase [Pyrinomonadaceae bacterium]